MAGSGRIVLSVVITAFVTASTASAFGGRLFGGGQLAPGVSNYYAVPYYYYCPPGPIVIPVPDAKPPMKYAPATPAPPSGTKEPPLGQMIEKRSSSDPRMPVIITSHASGGQARPPVAKDRCRVGFWNLSGRDLTITIDGKTMKLARDRAVTLDLDRQFTWQVEGRPQHVERLPDGQATHEVVIQDK
jgi:hypothetical protein